MSIEFGPDVSPADYGMHCLEDIKPKSGNKTEYTFRFFIDGQEMFDRVVVPNDKPQELVVYSSFDVACRTFNQYWTKYNHALRHVLATK